MPIAQFDRGTSLAVARQTPRQNGQFYSGDSPFTSGMALLAVLSQYGTNVAAPLALWIDATSATFKVLFVNADTASLPTGYYDLDVLCVVSGTQTVELLSAQILLT